ncbi:MAG: TIGR00730 family Rossman fold protein [Actinomycetota bacterium]|uniref:LOG family protein n=1 Tax=uncultured Ilumatobacter sp. TaxID=879968 RepID=UPI00374F5D88|nr:TIGR00730 family Rossman fold protein [Actinomycetota bacterium]
MSTICVYCGSSSGTDGAFALMAEALGTAIVEAGHRLVYGGGNVGLMGIVADAVIAGGGDVIGVITEQLLALEVGHDGLTELEVLPDMHSRKARMAELADGFVVLPGGFGTYEEAFEVLTWNQLGIVSTPVVFLDVMLSDDEQSFYDPLFDFIDGATAAGFMKPQHGGLAQRAVTPAEAVSIAAGPAPEFTRKWVG